MFSHQKKRRGVHSGTKMIDRIFPGIGRIEKASGTSDPSVHEAITGTDLRHVPLSERRDMLSVLYMQNHWDVLQRIQLGHKHRAQGGLRAVEVYHYWRRGRLHDLPSPEAAAPLAVFTTWAKHYDCSAEHRRGIVRTLESLAACGVKSLADLPEGMRRYRERVSDRPVLFNRARSHVSRFLADELGKSHSLYRRVRDIEKLKERPRREMSDLQKRLRAAELERMAPGVRLQVAPDPTDGVEEAHAVPGGRSVTRTDP